MGGQEGMVGDKPDPQVMIVLGRFFCETYIIFSPSCEASMGGPIRFHRGR